MSLVTIKIKKEVIPGYDPLNPTVIPPIAEKLFYFVGPCSSGFEHAFLPYNGGFYKKHNQAELDKRNILTAATPIWATYYEGMWLTPDELELFMKTEGWTGILISISNGSVEVANDGVPYTVEQLIDLRKQ